MESSMLHLGILLYMYAMGPFVCPITRSQEESDGFNDVPKLTCLYAYNVYPVTHEAGQVLCGSWGVIMCGFVELGVDVIIRQCLK